MTWLRRWWSLLAGALMGLSGIVWGILARRRAERIEAVERAVSDVDRAVAVSVAVEERDRELATVNEALNRRVEDTRRDIADMAAAEVAVELNRMRR